MFNFENTIVGGMAATLRGIRHGSGDCRVGPVDDKPKKKRKKPDWDKIAWCGIALIALIIVATL